jgi:phosphatidylethanolamine/phosphatidyl-N-methylethanolamine N-methyltransferase
MADSLFIRMLRSPRTIGSVVPSSFALAKEMACYAERFDSVIELGAGTGPITGLLAKKPFAKLEVVEIQPLLATKLQREYPYLRVTQSCASQALDKFRPIGSTGIVSSLPFRSLPATVKLVTIKSVLAYLDTHEDSLLIQFTYGPTAPFDVPDSYVWIKQGWVLRNVPPACIWTLSRATALPKKYA